MNNQETSKKPAQKQVSQRSGTPYSFNLDSVSLKSLSELQEAYRRMGMDCSQSVIIRRSLRNHFQSVQRLPDFYNEIIETKRAAKGVL